jgi:predicted permease
MRMDWLLQDVRFAARTLAKSPGTTVAAVLTLALAIGANTTMFGVVNAVVLRPLPYPDADRLVRVRGSLPSIGAEQLPMSPPEFADVRDRVPAFESVAAVGTLNRTVTGDGEPERVLAAYASASLIPMLGVRPAIGRTFTEDEDRDGFDRVAVIGYGLWQRRYGGSPGVVGKTMQLDGIAYTVVGVMPADFRYPSRDVDLWIPVAFTAEQYGDGERGSHFLGVLARLRPGATEDEAAAELRALAGAMQTEHPDNYKPDSGWNLTAASLKTDIVGDSRSLLFVLLGAVGLVLLIACANVANLMLARATARQREMAVRAALGASRWRIARQLLTEGVMLSAAGGGLGVLLAVWLNSVFVALQPARIPRYEELDVDWRVLAFTLAVSVAAGIAFALAPAVVAARPRLGDALKDSGRGASEGPAAARLRGALVVGEIALAVVVLVGAGLLVRSLDHLLHVPPGFDPAGVATMRVSLPDATYKEPVAQRAFYTRLLDRVRTSPGVRSAAAINFLPLGGSTSRRNFSIDGVGDVTVNVEFRTVSPGYFETMRIPVDRGRSLADSDREGSQFVTVVNESMARPFFPGEDPLGRRIKLGGMDGPFPWMTIVGVTGDVRHAGLDETAPPEMYVSYLQPLLPDWRVGSLFLAVRGDGPSRTAADAVRAAVRDLDPNLPVYDVRTMDERLSRSVSGRWFDTLSLSLLAALALALAVVGLYGVLAFSVSRRFHEIGIRMALGARPRDVMASVLGRGAALAAIGLAVGLACSLAASRLVAGLLFDVAPTDAWTFAAASGLLAAVALAAVYFPARRATRVDPLVALRHE